MSTESIEAIPVTVKYPCEVKYPDTDPAIHAGAPAQRIDGGCTDRRPAERFDEGQRVCRMLIVEFIRNLAITDQGSEQHTSPAGSC
jgi:hypothetical protein